MFGLKGILKKKNEEKETHTETDILQQQRQLTPITEKIETRKQPTISQAKPPHIQEYFTDEEFCMWMWF